MKVRSGYNDYWDGREAINKRGTKKRSKKAKESQAGGKKDRLGAGKGVNLRSTVTMQREPGK